MSERLDCMRKEFQAALREVVRRHASLAWLPATAGELLAEEAARSLKDDAQGRVYAADQYTLSFFARDLEQISTHASQVQLDLSRGLRSGLAECGVLVVRDPHVTLATDPTLGVRQVRVIAWHSRDPLKFSRTMPVQQTGAEPKPPAGAFLIVEGRRHFPLEKSLVRVGRRLDNDLVLEDPHVSRRHAEIQLHGNRYLVVDLQSTVGTIVNGRPIQRHALTPGDVISIAGVQIIYGEDSAGGPGETPPYAPPFRPQDGDPITPLHLRLPSPLKEDTPRKPRLG
jgi:hypothetical protein